MNRIYKVIYNRTLRVYQVVSELAKNVGGAGTESVIRRARRTSRVGTAAAVLSLLLAGGYASPVGAVDVNDGDAIVGGANITVTKDGSNQITISADGVATQAAVDALEGKVDTNTANISSNTGRISSNEGKIAANTSNITANTNAIAANAGNITANTNAIATNASNITANTNSIGSLRGLNSRLGLAWDKMGVKYFRANSTEEDAAATGTNSIAVGPKASTLGARATAIGYGSKANGGDSFVGGANSAAYASADKSVAIGYKAITGAAAGMTGEEGSGTVILGGGDKSVAIGAEAQARANSSIALGDGAVVMNDGGDNKINSNSMAIGTGARTVASDSAVAIGNGAKVAKKSHSAIAIGDGAEVSAETAVAFGKGAVSRATGAFAAGVSAGAEGVNAIALGNAAQSVGANTIAIGGASFANISGTIAVGNSANASAKDSIVLGTNAGKGMVGDLLGTKGSHVVIGVEAGENVDGSQNLAIGYKSGSNVTSDYNIAIGSNAGSNIGTTAPGGSAIGKNVSIGYNANKYAALTSVMQSTAVGSESTAADDAVAAGYNAKASGNGSLAVGFNAAAEDAASVALGQGAQASGGNIAIGNGSRANVGMIIGTGYLTGQAAPASVISVGDSGALRRIVNVADGAQDQDAVTVAQLKRSIDTTVSQINANIATAATGIQYDNNASGSDSVTLRNNTLIHNVADGSLDTDAVNVRQLNKLVNESKTHYYSVKTANMNNYNNDLATGNDSMAAGIGAKALGDGSVAVGNNIEAQGKGSIVLGVGYDPDGTGSMVQAVAVTGYDYNMAVGAGAQSYGNNSLAIGTRAGTTIKDGGTSVNNAIAIGYFAGASDDEAMAIGNKAKSNSKSAAALGDQAQALAASALAVGTEAVASGAASGAFGAKNNVSGAGTYVIGTENYADSAAGVGKNITAKDSGVFGNKNILEGEANRVLGNSNNVSQYYAKALKNVMVTGNDNVVAGDPDQDSEGDAKDMDGITVTGSGNKVQAANNTKELKNISIVGNSNTVNNLTDKSWDLSDVQILGSNVTATKGNSVYLGSDSQYTASGNVSKGTDAYTSHNGYQFAGGTPVGVVTVGAEGKERRIQNVAAGLISSQSTDAVNGSQLYRMTLPLRFAGDNSNLATGANVIKRGSDQAMSILGGADAAKLSSNNIGVVADSNSNVMSIKLAKELKDLTSVATTDGSGKTTVMNGSGITSTDGTKTTSVSANGVTITPSSGSPAGSVSLTGSGLDNGGNKIINVAEGTNGTDAVNVNQLKKVTNAEQGGGFGLADEAGNTVKKNLGETVSVVGDGSNITTKVSDGKLQISLNQDINVNSVTANTFTAGDTTVNSNGLTIQNGPSITKAGIDAGGKKITNVAAGVDDNDAVNVSQLKAETAAAKTKVEAGSSNVVVTSKTNDDKSTTYTVDLSNKLTLGDSDNSVTIDGPNGTIVAGGSAGNPVTINGKTGTVNGLTNKTWDPDNIVSGQAATEDQLKASETSLTNKGLKFNANSGDEYTAALGTAVSIKGSDKEAGATYSNKNITTEIDQQGNINILMNNSLTADEVIVGGKNGADGVNGKDGKIGVAGANGKDGVTITATGANGQDGVDGHIGINGKDGASADIHVKNGQNGVDGTDGNNGTDGMDRIVYTDHNNITHEVATMDDGLKFKGDDDTVIAKKLNQQLDIKGGADGSNLSDNNIGVVSDASGALNVKLAKDITGLSSITVTNSGGDKTVVDGNGININNNVKLTKDGLDNGGNKIVNVAPGNISPTSTDAVNGSQLYQTNQKITKLGAQVNKVGAGAAALAALHPLDFDPDDKWSVAAGFGNYRGENAGAIGAFYRPDENVMFSIGGTLGNGENMVNAGISFSLDGKNRITRSRTAMAKEIVELRSLITQMAARMDRLDTAANIQATMFPDVPENHWAYEYVEDLLKRGALKGYPDGLFKGDRSMTRYEFAAMLDRLVRNGIQLESRIAKEFEPELGRIYVERISGGDDDRNKIERVRVNNVDRDTRDVYGSKINPVQVKASK